VKIIAGAAALIIGAVIAACLVVQTWRGDRPSLSVRPNGVLHRVLLTNNQVYYGRLEASDRGSIALSHVFYVQVTADEKTGERTNKLVERRTNDWHSPTRMTIPTDKIVFVEEVGADSQVANLIAQSESRR